MREPNQNRRRRRLSGDAKTEWIMRGEWEKFW